MTDEVINGTLTNYVAIIARMKVRPTTELASKILNVQPLQSPTGLLCYLREKYKRHAEPPVVDYNALREVYRYGL